MTADMLLAFGILAAAILLFVTDRLRLDLVAILVVLALMLSGLLSPEEALAGFSDPLVLTIAGLFVVGGGLFQTGVADALGDWLARIAGRGEAGTIAAIMLVVAFLSAFMSSTGTTAVLLPVVVSLAWKAKLSPSKLLVPLAYASLIGGMLTLIGTPPNLVVTNYLASEGLEPFGFFSFTPAGLVMLALGIGFMALIGRHLLPRHAKRGFDVAPGEEAEPLSLADLMRAYELPGNLFRLRVRRTSPLLGRTLRELDLRARYQVNVLEVQPWPDGRFAPSAAKPAAPDEPLEEQDILLVQGTAEAVARLAREHDLAIRPLREAGGRYLSQELGMVEVLLTPRSRLIGRTLQDVRFRERYDVTVVAIMRQGKPLHTALATTPLRFGDTLLVQGTWRKIGLLLEERRNFIVVGQPREMTEAKRSTGRALLGVAIVGGMLILMTAGTLPIVAAVLLAAVAMLLSGCLTMEEAYASMNWESLVLIAGMLPMGTALEKTGGAQFVADGLVRSLGGLGPLAVMAGLCVLTMFFSQFISNTATAVLLTPIAFQAALGIGVSPHTFLMAVAVSASTAFATPIASPVNTLVLGPGGYRFIDFVKVGVALQLVVLVAALVMLPLLFPFF